MLLARFTAAGYHIQQNFHFHEGDLEVDLDGWDPIARVGYEYITREANDDMQFTPEALASFERRMARHELFVFLVDEREAITEAELGKAADAFLGEIADRRVSSARSARS